MTSDDIRNLHALLRRMQAADPDYRVFGATNHKYLLGPPLPEEALQAFEQQHRVTLPADYRLFLKEAGDGGAIRSSARRIAINAGARPGYGLLPLEETVAGCDVAAPFPFAPSTPEQPVQGNDDWGDETPWPGVLEISYSGCAFFSYLVVNGSAYGTVWDADVDQCLFYPTGLTFEAWYRRWLGGLIDTVF